MKRQLRRLYTLCRKETLQIMRDPSTLLVAIGFPAMLLFIFGFGINLDANAVRFGVVLEDQGSAARRFADTFASSPYFKVVWGYRATEMADLLRADEVRGFIVIRSDFSQRVEHPGASPALEVVTDGSQPNTASFIAAYARGTYGVWAREEAVRSGRPLQKTLSIEERFWFNPSTLSRNFLIPGSITIIMTVVGALLTALVVAREWERGTMEALLAAGVSRFELIACKLIPYFGLGMGSFLICTVCAVSFFHVPFRGSVPVLLVVASTFLLSALGLGLLLSTLTRNQFNAAQAALNAAFLPAMMLSGFIFEIASMPAPVRAFTTIIPARYFVSAIQTLFQAGNIWPVLARSMLGLTCASVFFIGLAFIKTRRRLE
jgi:ABC-2 type transport system permease protein